MTKLYNAFHRTWWKEAEPHTCWPNNLEPHMGEKHYLVRNVSFATARKVAQEYTNTHEPGRYSDKGEIEEA